MQINPFGFPLGAGMQSAPAIGGTGLGFADALGVAIEGSIPQPAGLVASPTPPSMFNAKLGQTLLAQAQLDVQPPSGLTAMPTAFEPQPGNAGATLPGLQQPTSLSQLLTTAAKLPVGEPLPAADPAPAPAPEIALPTGEPVVATAEAAPTPVSPSVPVPQPAAAPEQATQAAVDPEVEGEALPETISAETPPAKPQKGPRARTAAPDTDPIQPGSAQTAPVEMLAVVAVPQQVAQPQAAPREAVTPQTGTTAPSAKKVATPTGPSDAPTQATTAAGTPDFARAVAAQGQSTGSEANADGQPQSDAGVAPIAKSDAAAPHFPQPVHAAASADPARAPAPAAPAEPVIEARTGHLGHSMGVEIARKVELGEETLRIRLNPIELGRIEVTLAFDDKGSLQATMRTESTQAMDLLRQDAGDLARTLDQAGVRTDAQSFRFENRSGDGGGQQARQQHSQSNGPFASSDDDAVIADPIYRPVRSDGQVDLLA